MARQERVVNIFWEPDEDEPCGHTSIFRPVDARHEAKLLEQNEFSTAVAADSSPLACPINTAINAQFYEEMGFIPTSVGVENE